MIIDMIIVPPNDVKGLPGKQLNAVPPMYLVEKTILRAFSSHYSLITSDLEFVSEQLGP